MTSPPAAEPTFTRTDVSALLDFWFASDRFPPRGATDEATVRRWFLPSPEFAASCAIFKPLLTLLTTTPATDNITAFASSPKAALALVILLGQFPRILQHPQEVVVDYTPAQSVAEHAFSQGWDKGEHEEWKRVPAVRMWFLLPGGNSKDLAVLDRTVRRAQEVVSDCEKIVDGVWDGALVAEARNLLRFLEGRREEEVRKAAAGEAGS